jgi:hypothetical protein
LEGDAVPDEFVSEARKWGYNPARDNAWKQNLVAPKRPNAMVPVPSDVHSDVPDKWLSMAESIGYNPQRDTQWQRYFPEAAKEAAVSRAYADEKLDILDRPEIVDDLSPHVAHPFDNLDAVNAGPPQEAPAPPLPKATDLEEEHIKEMSPDAMQKALNGIQRQLEVTENVKQTFDDIKKELSTPEEEEKEASELATRLAETTAKVQKLNFGKEGEDIEIEVAEDNSRNKEISAELSKIDNQLEQAEKRASKKGAGGKEAKEAAVKEAKGAKVDESIEDMSKDDMKMFESADVEEAAKKGSKRLEISKEAFKRLQRKQQRKEAAKKGSSKNSAEQELEENSPEQNLAKAAEHEVSKLLAAVENEAAKTSKGKNDDGSPVSAAKLLKAELLKVNKKDRKELAKIEALLSKFEKTRDDEKEEQVELVEKTSREGHTKHRKSQHGNDAQSTSSLDEIDAKLANMEAKSDQLTRSMDIHEASELDEFPESAPGAEMLVKEPSLAHLDMVDLESLVDPPPPPGQQMPAPAVPAKPAPPAELIVPLPPLDQPPPPPQATDLLSQATQLLNQPPPPASIAPEAPPVAPAAPQATELLSGAGDSLHFSQSNTVPDEFLTTAKTYGYDPSREDDWKKALGIDINANGHPVEFVSRSIVAPAAQPQAAPAVVGSAPVAAAPGADFHFTQSNTIPDEFMETAKAYGYDASKENDWMKVLGAVPGGAPAPAPAALGQFPGMPSLDASPFGQGNGALGASLGLPGLGSTGGLDPMNFGAGAGGAFSPAEFMAQSGSLESLANSLGASPFTSGMNPMAMSEMPTDLLGSGLNPMAQGSFSDVAAMADMW